MHRHSHESDWQTKAAAVGEFFNHFITNPYFLAQFYDALLQSESENITLLEYFKLPSNLGLSQNGFYIGLPFSLSAIGAAYCHYKLNHNHQPAGASSPLLTAKALREQEETEYDIDDITGTTSHRNVPSLRWWQWAMLAGDGIAHVCEVAAPLSFVYDLSTKNLNLPSWVRTSWQSAAFWTGVIGAVAPVRTCLNSIQGTYSNKIAEGDRFTQANFWIDGAANIVSNAAWTSQLLGAFLAFINENWVDPIEKISDPFHVKSLDFWACIAIGVSTGATAAYLHKLLNKHHENSSTQIDEPINTTILYETDFDGTESSRFNLLKFFIKLADWYTHAGDKASSPSFIATLASRNNPMSTTTNLIVQLGALGFGLLTGKADSRTCVKEYEKEIELKNQIQSNYTRTKTPSRRQSSRHIPTLFGSINGDHRAGKQPIVIDPPTDANGDTLIDFSVSDLSSDSNYQRL